MELTQWGLNTGVKSKPLSFYFRLFVDRSEAKSVFGQQPGQYHGFANDYTQGGTYQVDTDRGQIVKDLNKYTRYKLQQKDFKPRRFDGQEFSDSSSKGLEKHSNLKHQINLDYDQNCFHQIFEGFYCIWLSFRNSSFSQNNLIVLYFLVKID